MGGSTLQTKDKKPVLDEVLRGSLTTGGEATVPGDIGVGPGGKTTPAPDVTINAPKPLTPEEEAALVAKREARIKREELARKNSLREKFNFTKSTPSGINFLQNPFSRRG